jgi:hypothetical protein
MTETARIGVLITLALFSMAARAEGVATYEVPVRRSLERYATFPVENLAVDRINNQLHVRFDLPKDLVGDVPVTIELHETAPLVLEGPKAEATCRSSAGDLECDIRYTKHVSYGLGAFKRLLRRYLGKHEYFKRLRVALSFSADPIGILKVPAGSQ